MTNEAIPAATIPDLFLEVAPGYSYPDPYDAPPLKWGILGPGGIARKFADNLPSYSGQRVIAVGSRNAERAAQFASEFGIDPAQAYGSYEELVADPEVDAVYVATPHIRHREDALLALRAGKPVLVEKSFAMSEEQAREVFDEADARGLFAMEAMWSRHLPHYAWIREVLKAGSLGPLRYFSADHGQSLRNVPRLVEPELGGGAMLDLGVYPLHFQQMVLGYPEKIQSASRLSEKQIDLSDMVLSSYPGATAVSTCQLDLSTPTTGELGFEGGGIQMRTRFYTPTSVVLEVSELDPQTMGVVGTRTETWDATAPGGFQYQAAEAARCIAAGKTQSDVVPWSATLDVQRMMDSVLKEAGYIDR
ncbi:MAG: Gfo/Idh/MocA family oxidoreductase [Scrofimicrobium sp.]